MGGECTLVPQCPQARGEDHSTAAERGRLGRVKTRGGTFDWFWSRPPSPSPRTLAEERSWAEEFARGRLAQRHADQGADPQRPVSRHPGDRPQSA